MSLGSLYENLLAGAPLRGELVIDAHMHVGKYYNFMIPSEGPEAIVDSAKRIGIKSMYGSSLLSIRNDAISGNLMAIQVQEKYPGIFYPYLVAKPNYPEEIAQVIDGAVAHNIRQFKIHDDGNGMAYDHHNYFPLYEYANSVGGVILVHTYGAIHVRPTMAIAKQFTSLKILLGHSGIIDEDIYYLAVRSCPNVYLETCNSWAWYGLIERMVKNSGADRICFGTDTPFMSPDQQIGRILGARITDDEKRRILGLNAERIFSSDNTD